MTTNKYQFSIYMNTPETTIKLNIPNHLQDKDAKFIVSSIVAKMKTTTSAVFIHSFALRNSEILYTQDNSNSLIATTVASPIVSNPLNVNIEVGDLGFQFPRIFAFGGDIDLILKDQVGNLLTDIDFAVITIDVAEANNNSSLY